MDLRVHGSGSEQAAIEAAASGGDYAERGRRPSLPEAAKPMFVLIADPHPAFRELVRRQLGHIASVVAETSNGEEAVRLAIALRPDVALVNARLEALDGLAATARIKSDVPETKVILITAHTEEAYLNDTGRSGADLLLPMREARTTLLKAIRELAPPWDGKERRGVVRPRQRWDGRERRRSRSPRE